MRGLTPDDVRWPRVERRLSTLRKEIADAAWLDIIEPERRDSLRRNTRGCDCFEGRKVPRLHRDVQDTECDGWKRLCDEVEAAALDQRTELAPMLSLSPEEAAQIVTLPETIAKLTSVRSLNVYGTRLSRIPPEIGAMTSLATFVPYTSYRLHWFPYEITRCRRLRSSTVSTRALYGNITYRWHFPRLTPPTTRHSYGEKPTRRCSVCDALFVDEQRHRVWISRMVATDVLPLLVNACSEACIASLPPGHDGYIATPHRGGVQQQPAPRY